MGKEFNPGRRIFLGLMLTWAASRLASCVPGVRGQEIQDGDEVVVVRDGGAPCVRNIFDGEFNCWRKATEDPDNRVATLPVGTVLRARGHEIMEQPNVAWLEWLS